MKGVKIIVIAVIVVIIAGIGFYGYHYETTGTMKVGTYAPSSTALSPAFKSAVGISPDANIFDLNVTVSTIGLYNSTTGWHNYTIDKSVTVFSTSPSNSSIFDSLSVHAGSYSKILLNITGMSIYWASVGISQTNITLSHPLAIIVHAITIHAHGSTTLFLDFNLGAFATAAKSNSSANVNSSVNATVMY